VRECKNSASSIKKKGFYLIYRYRVLLVR